MKRLAWGLLCLAASLVLGTLVLALYRERLLDRVHLGMERDQVEALLGPAIQYRPQEWSGLSTCARCRETREEFVYKGNASLWFGRFEDALHVCYERRKVCDMSHVGL